MKRKGIALFMVLATILMAVIISGVVLSLITSQSRLTHHQVSRIRAYYASTAGVNLALEKLRTGTWTQDATANRYYCINNRTDTGVVCTDTIADLDIPYNVQITVYPANTIGIPPGTIKIDAKSDYTYQ